MVINISLAIDDCYKTSNTNKECGDEAHRTTSSIELVHCTSEDQVFISTTLI
jgi:hypothetical protein